MPILAQQPQLLSPLIAAFPVDFELFLRAKAKGQFDGVRPDFSGNPIISDLFYNNLSLVASTGQGQTIATNEFKLHIEKLMCMIVSTETFELFDIWLYLARIHNCYYITPPVDEFEKYVETLIHAIKEQLPKPAVVASIRLGSQSSDDEVEKSPYILSTKFMDCIMLFMECSHEGVAAGRLNSTNYYYLLFLLFSSVYKSLTQQMTLVDVDCDNEQLKNLRQAFGELSQSLEFEVPTLDKKALIGMLLDRLKAFLMNLKPKSLKLIKAFTVVRLGVFYLEILTLAMDKTIENFSTVLAFIITKINSCGLNANYYAYGLFLDNVSSALSQYKQDNADVQTAAADIDSELHHLILVDHSIKMNVVAMLQFMQINFQEEYRAFSTSMGQIEALAYDNSKTDVQVLKSLISHINTLLAVDIIRILFKLVLTVMLIWAGLAYKKLEDKESMTNAALVGDVLHFIKYIHKTFHLHSLYNSFDPQTTEVTVVQKALLKMNTEVKVNSIAYYQRLKGFLKLFPEQQVMLIDNTHILYKIFAWQMHNKNPFGAPYDDQGKWGYKQTLTDCDRQQVYINGIHIFPLVGDLKDARDEGLYGEMKKRLLAVDYQEPDVESGERKTIKLEDWQVNFCLSYAAVQGIYDFANVLFGSLPFLLDEKFNKTGAIKQSDKVTEIKVLDEDNITMLTSICIEGFNDGSIVHTMNPAIVIKGYIDCKREGTDIHVIWKKFEILGAEQWVKLPELRTKAVQPGLFGLWNSQVYYTWRDVFNELHSICHLSVSRPIHDRELTTARQRSLPSSPVKWSKEGDVSAVPAIQITTQEIGYLLEQVIPVLVQPVRIMEPLEPVKLNFE